MFAANPVDPSRVIAISFLEPGGPSVPYPRRAGRARPLAVTLVAAGALAFAAAAMGGGVAAPAGTTHKVAAPAVTSAVPGEFRLGPGNNQPPGITVGLPATGGSVPGEFRLGPGNNQPPGITVGR
jgi:hypothetical protein